MLVIGNSRKLAGAILNSNTEPSNRQADVPAQVIVNQIADDYGKYYLTIVFIFVNKTIKHLKMHLHFLLVYAYFKTKQNTNAMHN